MADDDKDRRDPPSYNVYRSGSGGKRAAKGAAGSSASRGGSASGSGSPRDSSEAGGPADGPGYSIYRGSKNPLAKLREAGGGSIGERLSGLRNRSSSSDRVPGERPTWRRVLRWALIGAGLWILLSIVLFGVSAQIQKGKLNDSAANELGSLAPMVFSGQTILVIGTDVRPVGVPDDNGNPTKQKCVSAASDGDPHPSDCLPTRADTLMLVRAGGGAFQKLSIPRDTYAAIPGQDSQKINAAYAFGGAALEIKTVEDFLGITIDHAVIVDFSGFADFIDAIGGVEVSLRAPVKSLISGGASNGGITLKLAKGRNTLDGQRALALARTRENAKNASENDTQRAQRQQLILAGIKNRLTSPTRLPYNFLHGPWIAWNAPKAMVSDMGALTLPQLAISAAIGGNAKTKVLQPSGRGARHQPACRAEAVPQGRPSVPRRQLGREAANLLAGGGRGRGRADGPRRPGHSVAAATWRARLSRSSSSSLRRSRTPIPTSPTSRRSPRNRRSPTRTTTMRTSRRNPMSRRRMGTCRRPLMTSSSIHRRPRSSNPWRPCARSRSYRTQSPCSGLPGR